MADRVRRELAELFGTAHDGKPGKRGAMPVSISFGIVTYPSHGQSVEALLHAADRALDTAKRQGRNRAVVYRPNSGPAYSGPPIARSPSSTRGATQARRRGRETDLPGPFSLLR